MLSEFLNWTPQHKSSNRTDSVKNFEMADATILFT